MSGLASGVVARLGMQQLVTRLTKRDVKDSGAPRAGAATERSIWELLSQGSEAAGMLRRWVAVGAFGVAATLVGCAPVKPRVSRTPGAARAGPPPVIWARVSRPVYGLSLETPDSWQLNETPRVTVLAPKPPTDDGVIVFVVSSASSGPEKLAKDYLPLESVHYAPGAAKVSHGFTRTTGSAVLAHGMGQATLSLMRARTASGHIAILVLERKSAGAPTRKGIARMVRSMKVVDPPVPPKPPTPPRDLAGRPLGGGRSHD
jgi:hypothetical protein